MNGYAAMVRKEVQETLHTWRLVVLPGFLLLLAVASPVLASLAPKLLAGTMGAIAASLPTPTAWDAYAQWTKNLTPMALLLVLIGSSGAINGEIGHGTAALVLTKPVSRPAFVLAKFTVVAAWTALVTLVATAVAWGVARALFGQAPLMPLVRSTAAWLLLALLFLGLALALSSMMPSALGGAGVGLAIVVVLLVLGAWHPAARFTPAGLPGVVTRLGQAGEADWLWPTLTTGVAVLGLLALAVVALGRRDI